MPEAIQPTANPLDESVRTTTSAHMPKSESMDREPETMAAHLTIPSYSLSPLLSEMVDCVRLDTLRQCASGIKTIPVVLLRVLRQPAWSLSPYTSNRTTFVVDACSTNNCTRRGRFFKYRPRRFKLVIDCSVCFCMSLAILSSSMTALACPATNTPLSSLRYGIVSFAMRSFVEMSSTPLPAFFD